MKTPLKNAIILSLEEKDAVGFTMLMLGEATHEESELVISILKQGEAQMLNRAQMIEKLREEL